MIKFFAWVSFSVALLYPAAYWKLSRPFKIKQAGLVYGMRRSSTLAAGHSGFFTPWDPAFGSSTAPDIDCLPDYPGH